LEVTAAVLKKTKSEGPNIHFILVNTGSFYTSINHLKSNGHCMYNLL